MPPCPSWHLYLSGHSMENFENSLQSHIHVCAVSSNSSLHYRHLEGFAHCLWFCQNYYSTQQGWMSGVWSQSHPANQIIHSASLSVSLPVCDNCLTFFTDSFLFLFLYKSLNQCPSILKGKHESKKLERAD